jgi:hypothetical protein
MPDNARPPSQYPISSLCARDTLAISLVVKVNSICRNPAPIRKRNTALLLPRDRTAHISQNAPKNSTHTSHPRDRGSQCKQPAQHTTNSTQSLRLGTRDSRLDMSHLRTIPPTSLWRNALRAQARHRRHLSEQIRVRICNTPARRGGYAVSLLLLRFLIRVTLSKIGELVLQHLENINGVVVGFAFKGDGARLTEFVGTIAR